MVAKDTIELIDKEIKNIWLNEICEDYGAGRLIKEASLQCSLYHHLSNNLSDLLKKNNLYIYPEAYFKKLKYSADLVIARMDMGKDTTYLWDRLVDIIAVIELKYDGGSAKTTEDYMRSDIDKFKNYIKSLPYDCQYYFGTIYETDRVWLPWLDKRSTNNWAKGRFTELNAGYLDDRMIFQVNSYNGMNDSHTEKECEIMFW